MKAQNESTIQQQVIQYLSLICNQYNFVYFAPMNEGLLTCFKVFKVPDRISRPMYQWFLKMGFLPGVSDLVIIWQGKAYFIELKRIGGKKRATQVLFCKNVLKAGAEYGTAHDLDEVKWMLGEWGII